MSIPIDKSVELDEQEFGARAFARVEMDGEVAHLFFLPSIPSSLVALLIPCCERYTFSSVYPAPASAPALFPASAPSCSFVLIVELELDPCSSW